MGHITALFLAKIRAEVYHARATGTERERSAERGRKKTPDISVGGSRWLGL